MIYLFSQTISVYAEIPQDEFTIIDNNNQKTIKLGSKLSGVLDIYDDITIRGEKSYSNITFIEYTRNGIIFSISKRAKIAKDAHILGILITSDNYYTKKKLSIGNTKDDVIKSYGIPDDIIGSYFIYCNSDYDHLELIFYFDDNGIIKQIEMYAGT